MTLPLPLLTTPPAPPALPAESPSRQIRTMASTLLTVGPLRRGYEREAVDRLVETACSRLDDLHNIALQQRTYITGAWAELQARRDGTLPDRSLQGPVGEAMAGAQRAAMQQGDQVQQTARQQGQAIVQAAQAQAAQIIAEAQQRAEAMDEQAADLRRVTTGLLCYLDQSGAAFRDAHTAYSNELRRIAGSPVEIDA